MLYRTPVWCDVTHDMKDAERGQSQAAYMPGKREPETGNDLRNPHRWDTRLACCQVPWHTRGERRTTGPEDCEHAQKGSHDAKEELLQNQKMRSYRPHTDSETKTVTIEPGCRDTTIVHTVPSPGAQQGPDFNRLRARHMADTSRHEKKQ